MFSIKERVTNIGRIIFEDSLSVFDWVSIFFVMSMSQRGGLWLFAIIPLLAFSIYMRKVVCRHD